MKEKHNYLIESTPFYGTKDIIDWKLSLIRNLFVYLVYLFKFSSFLLQSQYQACAIEPEYFKSKFLHQK